MILDEAIKHAEEVAVEQDKLCKRYDDASGYSRSHNEAIRTTDAKRCEECASEHRQLAEWLEDYKRLKEQEPCDKCVYSTSEGCQYDDITETIPPFETSDDAISRQAVLDSIHANCVYENEYNLTAKHIEDAVKQLPSVTPQPKAGHWIRVEKDKLRCSECEVIHFIAQYPQGKIAWCPNCGARMVEPQEGEEKK